MNNRYWFFTVPVARDITQCTLFAPSAMANEKRVPTAIAIEIIRRTTSWIVLVSAFDADRDRLECLFAISGDPGRCDGFAHFGIPAIEGDVRLEGGSLTVSVPVFKATAGVAGEKPEPAWILRIHDVIGEQRKSSPVSPVYRQLMASPDIARPDSELVGRLCESGPERRADQTSAAAPGKTGSVEFATDVRYPDLFKLVKSPTADVSEVSTGHASRWRARPRPQPSPAKPASLSSPARRFNRVCAFGSPAFVFDNLEIVGFRIAMPSAAALERLVEPLNFHRSDGDDPLDFLYRAATQTLVIELLRYGSMRARDPVPPLRKSDFMCQHELLARVLVGRVDDDTSQARDAATFVPAIFVDNPWSKALGRRLQGFPKALAEFRTAAGALDMNGRLKGTSDVAPFSALTEVRAVGSRGALAKDRILTLDCPDSNGVDEAGFISIPAFLDSTVFRRSPFDQFDFNEVEFRRSFARLVISDGFDLQRSVQVSPVDGLHLPKTWIAGECKLTQVRAAFPTGVATLSLHSGPSSPRGWRQICRVLNGAADTLAFPTGDWYRVRASMELTIDDTLSWDSAS